MNIVLIDDHQIIIDGYKAILLGNQIAVENEITTINSLFEAFNKVNYFAENNAAIDLFILDYNMPSDHKNKLTNGLDLALLIKAKMPNAKIVMLTSTTTPLILHEIISKVNPTGLWLKTDLGYLAFLEYIKIVLSGASVYSESVKISYDNVKKFYSSFR